MSNPQKYRKNLIASVFIAAVFLVYLGSYTVRNILGTVTPQLRSASVFNDGTLGTFSSVLFAFYGIGQLINGFLGEKVNVKWMISVGLILSSACTFTFAMTDSLPLRLAVWAINGLALSMLYAPLTKALTEHLPQAMARIGYLFLSVASTVGSTVAGLYAGLSENWKVAFTITAFSVLVPCVLFLLVLSFLQKNPIDRENDPDHTAPSSTPVFSFRTFFSCFGLSTLCILFANMAINASRQATAFWATSFIADYLNFGEREAAFIFALLAALKAVIPFVSLKIWKLCRENERFVMVASTSFAGICYLLLFFLPVTPLIGVILLGVALLSIDCAAALIGSVYLLDFKQFGCVSAMCGFFDSTSYLVTAVCTRVYGSILGTGGWNAVGTVWISMCFAAALIMTIVIHKKKHPAVSEERRKKLLADMRFQ